MRFSKYFTVSVICAGCGSKLDAVLGDDDKNDIAVVVDNTHICQNAQPQEQLFCECVTPNFAPFIECQNCGKPPHLEE